MREKPLVLIADDSRSIVNIVSVVLKARNIDTLEAYDGRQAWNLFEEHEPDLAVLDIVMPGRTGLELCSDIRSHPRLSHIPVLIMTSITKDSDLADGFWKLGTSANDFVTKPFDPFDIADRIERLLRKAQQISDRKSSDSEAPKG
ncbi:MAG TPA: response regulator [bacterium]|nr:response regulator [bacterium]